MSLQAPLTVGRQRRSATYYYWSLGVVFLTMGTLAAMRWAEDYHLFMPGTLAFAAATVGRRMAPSRTPGHVRLHVVAMGLSYILMLTAFYVDNGPNLPLWRSLPAISYWVLPLVVGAPIMARVLRRHPVVLAERRG